MSQTILTTSTLERVKKGEVKNLDSGSGKGLSTPVVYKNGRVFVRYDEMIVTEKRNRRDPDIMFRWKGEYVAFLDLGGSVKSSIRDQITIRELRGVVEVDFD